MKGVFGWSYLFKDYSLSSRLIALASSPIMCTMYTPDASSDTSIVCSAAI